jgi:hypothetical protein
MWEAEDKDEIFEMSDDFAYRRERRETIKVLIIKRWLWCQQ